MGNLAKLSRSIDNLLGVDGLVDDIKDLALIGAGAGVAMIGANLAFDRIAFLSARPWWQRALIVGVGGVAGGIVLGRYVHKGLGAGFGGALVGSAVAGVAAQFLPQIGGGAEAPPAEAATGYWGDGENDEDPALYGLEARGRGEIPGMDGLDTRGPDEFEGMGMVVNRDPAPLAAWLS